MKGTLRRKSRAEWYSGVGERRVFKKQQRPKPEFIHFSEWFSAREKEERLKGYKHGLF
jgi:hypothetical protein